MTFIRKFSRARSIGTHFGLNDVKLSKTFEIVGVVREANYTDPVVIETAMSSSRSPSMFYEQPMAQMIDDRTHMIESVVLRMRGTGRARAAGPSVLPD
jgi:hypothetical protein